MAPKIGDTRNWDERAKTGYKWENTPYGERWVQYYNGKAIHIGGTDLLSLSKLQSAFANRNQERIAESRKGKTQIKTARGSRWVTDPNVFAGDEDSRNYTIWLQDKITNSKNEAEKKRYTTQYFALVGSDNADMISKEIGGDDNFIQPQTWQKPFYGDERDEQDPDIVAAEAKPSTGDLSMFDEVSASDENTDDGDEIVTNKEDLNKKSNNLKTISEAERELGTNPWARKSLMDSPRAANEATWRLLEEEGYDLRGLGLSDKQDLARDYRLDRLNKTDKGMFFRNRFMRKK